MIPSISLAALLASLPTPPVLVSGDGRGDTDVHLLCDDSRCACEGALFVCIRGAASDGHRYLPAAYEAGCRLFLVETDERLSLPTNATVYRSDDTHRDLAYLAAAYYGHPARRLRMVGITGTKGKTTVALMCRHMLEAQGESVGYIGTSGVYYADTVKETSNTTPGALELHRLLAEMVEAGVTTAVLEVSSQALWQRRVDGVRFDVCALTNLSPDHIGAPEHPSLEHYAACKRRLLTDFGATALVTNADAPAVSEDSLQGLVRCGLAADATVRALDIRQELCGVIPSTVFTCRTPSEHLNVRMPLLGIHNVQNALFALAIVRALGASLTDAAASLADITIAGRFETLEVKGALVVIDYAHNGAALRAMLTTLRALSPTRLLCLFGSVGGRTQCRRAELGAVADELADFTYLTADDPNFEAVEDICRDIAAAFRPRFLPNYTVIPDRAEAIRAALDELREGDILILAGKGDERTQRIAGRAIPHRDRDVVEAYIRQSVLPV